MNKELKHTDAFKELGSNSAQMVTKILCKNWKLFLVTVKGYTNNPDKYFAKPKIPRYLKKDRRIHRGLFVSNKGIKINADVNAAYQIMKKVFSNITNEIVSEHLHPVIINL